MDVEDILYRASIDGYREKPSNANPTLHDEALLCVTDLEDCCETPRTVRGNWYYPDGRIVNINNSISGPTFQSNRGPNELVNNNRQFYGSVRLWRRWSNPPERGRFRCELPSAADPSVNQVLYANLGKVIIYAGSIIIGDKLYMGAQVYTIAQDKWKGLDVNTYVHVHEIV